MHDISNLTMAWSLKKYMCFIHFIDFINAQRKVALKLPQFEMLYKGLLFVYLSTSVDRTLNGVHVPLQFSISNTDSLFLVPRFRLRISSSTHSFCIGNNIASSAPSFNSSVVI